MNMFGGFQEKADVSERKESEKAEISREAQDKFDRMFDEKFDEKLDVRPEEARAEIGTETGMNPVDESRKEVLDQTTEDMTENKTDNYRIPKSGGEWSGEPGNSRWIPDSNIVPGDRNGTNPENKFWKEIVEQYGIDGVPFQDGKPDFSEISKGNVEIQDFSGNRRKNFVQADEAMAEQRGCDPGEVRQWRMENKYTWHEEPDCKTMRKVPSEVHGNIPHDGGIFEMKKQEFENEQE